MVVVLALLTGPLAGQPPPVPAICKEMIEEWKQHQAGIPAVVSFDSGKFPNDLGDFNDCEFHRDENVTFLTMSVFNALAMSYQYVGLCLPNECVDYVLSPDFANNTQAYFNEMYQEGTNSSAVPFKRMKFINPVADAPTVHHY